MESCDITGFLFEVLESVGTLLRMDAFIDKDKGSSIELPFENLLLSDLTRLAVTQIRSPFSP